MTEDGGDGGSVVAGGYQVDVGGMMGVLEVEHDLSEALGSYVDTGALGEGFVLAIDATEGAMSEEDGTASLFADQARLFPPVKRSTADVQRVARTAHSHALSTIHTTRTRTERACFIRTNRTTLFFLIIHNERWTNSASQQPLEPWPSRLHEARIPGHTCNAGL